MTGWRRLITATVRLAHRDGTRLRRRPAGGRLLLDPEGDTTNRSAERVRDIVTGAWALSAEICQGCGGPGDPVTLGRGGRGTRCGDCREPGDQVLRRPAWRRKRETGNEAPGLLEDLVGAQDLADLMDARHTPATHASWPVRRSQGDPYMTIICPIEGAGWNHLLRGGLAVLLPLEWMKTYVRKHGRSPTRTEVSEGLGLHDATSVRTHLRGLEKKGYIEILKDKYRGIRIFEAELPLVQAIGEVAAGTPIVAEEHIIQRVPAVIAEQFRPKPDYLLKVVGDSMDATGLCEGDVVAVRKTASAESGQVVVARFGDDVTLKRLIRINERNIDLRPESHNKAHKVMKLDLAKHIVDIDGVVVGALIGELRDGRKGGRKQAAATPRRMKPKTRI